MVLLLAFQPLNLGSVLAGSVGLDARPAGLESVAMSVSREGSAQGLQRMFAYAPLSRSRAATASSSTLPPVHLDLRDHGAYPATAVVLVGQSVVWTNRGARIHTVTEGEPVFRTFLPMIMTDIKLGEARTTSTTFPDVNHSPIFDSGSLASGERFTYTVTSTGTFTYYSIYSPADVVGRLVAVEPVTTLAAPVDAAAARSRHRAGDPIPSGACQERGLAWPYHRRHRTIRCLPVGHLDIVSRPIAVWQSLGLPAWRGRHCVLSQRHGDCFRRKQRRWRDVCPVQGLGRDSGPNMGQLL